MKTRRYSKYFSSLFLFIDLLFLNIGFFAANYIRFDQFWFQEDKYPFLYVFLNVAWVVIYFLTKINNIEREKSIIDYISQVLLALTINIAVVFTMWASTRAYFYSREHLFYTYLIFSFAIVSWRIAFIYLIRYSRTKGYNIRKVVIVGHGNIGKNLANHFKEDTWLGYKVMGFFDHNTKNESVIGNLDDLKVYAKNKSVDIIFCCLPKLYDDDVKSIINFAENNLIGVKILSDFSTISNKRLSIQQYGKIPVINVSSIPLDGRFNRVVKRTFDIVFSSLVMILIMSWLVPLIGLLIKL
jgi:putative colanic acid biosynthesis UDP-glucose lipid carrier transferase